MILHRASYYLAGEHREFLFNHRAMFEFERSLKVPAYAFLLDEKSPLLRVQGLAYCLTATDRHLRGGAKSFEDWLDSDFLPEYLSPEWDAFALWLEGFMNRALLNPRRDVLGYDSDLDGETEEQDPDQQTVAERLPDGVISAGGESQDHYQSRILARRAVDWHLRRYYAHHFLGLSDEAFWDDWDFANLNEVCVIHSSLFPQWPAGYTVQVG